MGIPILLVLRGFSIFLLAKIHSACFISKYIFYFNYACMFVCVWAFVYMSACACQGGAKLMLVPSLTAVPLFTAERTTSTKSSQPAHPAEPISATAGLAYKQPPCLSSFVRWF